MPYNPIAAERRRRHQEVTGKIGVGQQSYLTSSAVTSLEARVSHQDGANIAAQQRRGHLASLGAFINQDIDEVESTKFKPQHASNVSPNRQRPQYMNSGYDGGGGPYSSSSYLGGGGGARSSSPLLQQQQQQQQQPQQSRHSIAMNSRSGQAIASVMSQHQPQQQQQPGLMSSNGRGYSDSAAATDDAAAQQQQQLALYSSKLSNQREFGQLMQLVYTNHGEASRSYLTFRPDVPPF